MFLNNELLKDHKLHLKYSLRIQIILFSNLTPSLSVLFIHWFTDLLTLIFLKVKFNASFTYRCFHGAEWLIKKEMFPKPRNDAFSVWSRWYPLLYDQLKSHCEIEVPCTSMDVAASCIGRKHVISRECWILSDSFGTLPSSQKKGKQRLLAMQCLNWLLTTVLLRRPGGAVMIHPSVISTCDLTLKPREMSFPWFQRPITIRTERDIARSSNSSKFKIRLEEGGLSGD